MEKKQDNQTDTLQAIAQTLNNFTGSLTGKNLEEKLIEYSEVYGEILIYLYKTIEHHKNEIKFLKKEISRLEKLIKEKNNISNLDTTNKYKNHIRLLYFMIFINILFIIFLIIK